MMSSGKSSESSSLSKADYLKKYLSGGSSAEKPRSKKPSSASSKVRIKVVDDDAEAHIVVSEAPKKKSGNVFDDHDDASDLDEANFKPTIAEFVDERPEDVQLLEKFSASGKWKGIGDPSDRSAVISQEGYKRRLSSSSSSQIVSKPVSSSKQTDEEPSAGVIILPDVRRSTAMRKAEEAAAVTKMKEEERQEKYSKWSKGLTQISQQRERAEEAVKEMAKPLARYADDEDLEKTLRDKDRVGDPMLAFKKTKKAGGDEAPGSSQQIKRPHRGPPNRFNIPPGTRWDGVDRSSGFERELFLKMADRKTIREEEYIWSVGDW